MTESADLAILFADVCGSTALYESLGDAKASGVIGHCLTQIEAAGHVHGGELVKTIGDEIMMVFNSANAAADAAHAMHEAAHATEAQPGTAMAIHIGFHFGSAMRHGRDVLGDSVNLAARLVSLSKAGQTLTSAITLDHLSKHWTDLARQVDNTQVRGRTGQVTMYELIWQPEEATRMVAFGRNTPAERPAARLLLSHRGKEVKLGPEHPIVTLGRAESCDLVIRHDLASRLHAKLEYRKDRFLLTDQSTNGTYVRPSKGSTLFLRRDTQPISGTGAISLGASASEDQEDLVSFTQLS